MKTLYFDCSMGAAGDMLVAALYDLARDKSAADERLYAIAAALPGVEFRVSTEKRASIAGLHFSVSVGGEEEHAPDGDHSHHEHEHMHHHKHHHHSHSSLGDISDIIQSLPVSDWVKAHAGAVYGMIAAAESRAHGEPVQLVHFHELGALDAVFDVAAACSLIELLGVDSIAASPVNVGGGSVKTSHGTVPVPAPATAALLEGVPTYGDGELKFELCTPTGAALIKTFAKSFGAQPAMTVEAVGYGLGTMDFPTRPNMVRALLGTTSGGSTEIMPNEEITELLCNIDDMTGEALGAAAELLRAEGALDVSFIPVTGKKSRPGFILSCLCRVEDEPKMAKLMLEHTSTFGVRGHRMFRYALEREFTAREDGIVLKHGFGYGVNKTKEEFDTVKQVNYGSETP